MKRIGMLVVLAAASAACSGGGGDNSPTSPGGNNTGNNQTISTVAVSGSITTVNVGSAITMSAVALNSSGQTVSATFAWSSSNSAVATVGAATGVVTGVAAGNATISASAGGKTGTRDITVTTPGGGGPPPQAATITMPGTSFEPNNVTIGVGGRITFVFSALAHNVFFGGSNAPANIPDTTNSSVDRTFTSAGSYTISCTLHSGMSGTITVQ